MLFSISSTKLFPTLTNMAVTRLNMAWSARQRRYSATKSSWKVAQVRKRRRVKIARPNMSNDSPCSCSITEDHCYSALQKFEVTRVKLPVTRSKIRDTTKTLVIKAENTRGVLKVLLRDVFLSGAYEAWKVHEQQYLESHSVFHC